MEGEGRIEGGMYEKKGEGVGKGGRAGRLGLGEKKASLLFCFVFYLFIFSCQAVNLIHGVAS